MDYLEVFYYIFNLFDKNDVLEKGWIFACFSLQRDKTQNLKEKFVKFCITILSINPKFSQKKPSSLYVLPLCRQNGPPRCLFTSKIQTRNPSQFDPDPQAHC